MSNEKVKRFAVVSFFIAIFTWIATLFKSKQEINDYDFIYQRDFEPEPTVEEEEDDSPFLQIEYIDGSYEGHLFHEIKIDLAGRVYFKISGKWEVQKNIKELFIGDVITGDKMAKGFKDALERAKK